MITKKRLIGLTSVVFIIIASIFGYLYYKKVNPMDLVASVPVGEIGRPPEFSNYIFGAEKKELTMPLSVVVDSKEIFVSDSDKGVVQVFDYNGKFLRFIGDQTKGKLQHPYGIAFNGGEVYVADGGNAKITIFNRDGNFLRYFETKEEYYAVPGQLVIKDNRLMFPDLALNKVFVYDINSGELLFTFGRKGDLPGQFTKPHGLAIDSKGNFYVADSNNNRVQMFNKDGKFVKIAGENGGTQILTPRGLFIDENDHLFAVSGLAGEVSIFAPEGGKVLANFGNDPVKGDSLSLPNGIWIDGNRVFISETTANRIAIFKY